MNIKYIINRLNYYTDLYNKGIPEISDKEWDELYFALKAEEEESGIIYPNSPTQTIRYETMTQLNKVKHNHLMLSLDKSKDKEVIKSFLKNQPFVGMLKMDGLTCSLTYENGQLVKAETRGNGIEGEDILHNAKVVKNIPQTIYYKKKLVVDGEIICRKDDFAPFEKEYKNPRNFASGSIRLLSSKECFKRNLSFIAWDMVEGYLNINEFSTRLYRLYTLGFDVVPFFIGKSNEDFDKVLNKLKEDTYNHNIFPTDGYVFKFNDVKYGKEQGQTDHHFKNAIALKEYDELYDTRLKYITWTMGRTGVLTPIAIFDPINIDGSTIERASLHNVSIMREILGDCAYIGEPLQVYKANQIIPQIAEAGPKYDYGYVIAHGGVSANDTIEKCPICGGDVAYITSDDGVINAYCDNPFCEGKLINRLEHFCGKKGLNIKGLSKATFQKLIDWKWLKNIEGIFNLNQYKDEWINKPGFGVKSVDKILQSIEESKHTTLVAFLSAIGIPLVGQATAKDLTNHFKNYSDFRDAVMDDTYHFFTLDNIGTELNDSIKNFDYTEADELSKILIFDTPVVNYSNIDNVLANKTIVITGKLTTFKNRNELKQLIISHGGKVSETVSSSTSYLINNDEKSQSSKNLKAKKLGIQIISEKDFLKIFEN